MKKFPVLVVILSTSLHLCLSVELCGLTNPPFIRIPENVTVGTVVGRFDIIGNENEVVLEASRSSSNYFNVNITSREITLASALDYEIHGQESFRVVIRCSQQNPTLSVDLSLIVALTDVNDNSPIFSSEEYTAKVKESAQVNSIIYSGITATDGDKTNLYMQYDVVPGPYSSYLDFERASTGEVTLKKSLDYEIIQSFTVQIKALDTPSDTNSPRRSAVTNLTILVQNEDDMDPAFSRDHYEAEIDSSTEAGAVIVTSPPIYAEDQDLSPKSPVVYSLWDYNDAFKIDNRTGMVTLVRQLEGGTYTGMLRAEQTDNPSRRAVATLTVLVPGTGTTGTYNRRPRFLKKTYDVTVFENTPIGQTLISVPALDPDVKDTLTYSLTDDKEGTFAISNIADIELLKPLDYESAEQFSLQVTVTDGSATSTATVVISVADVNDNNPEVAEPNIFVQTERKPNSFIAQVEASDKDRFSQLSFSVVGEEKRFSVNNEGKVYMTGAVEDFPGTEYSIVILVQDDGLPPRQATARVQISLPEINMTDVPTTGAIMEEPSDAVAIVLGIVAAILLFVVIVLTILLIRRKKREGNSEEQIETPNPARRAFQDENLEKVKPPSHLDPEGLAYRSTSKPQTTLFPTTVDLNRSDHGETEDGATTVQENPITGPNLLSRINHGYSGSDLSEAGHDMGDIRIQTSMTPYNNNDYPGYVENDMYGAGDMKTFHHSASSNESLSSDSTPGSKKQLVKPDLMEHGKPNSRPFSWNNLNGSTVTESNGDIPNDGRRSAEDKPEITVYF